MEKNVCKYGKMLIEAQTKKDSVNEKEVEKRIEVARINSQQSILALKSELLNQESALETQFMQPSLNFAAIRSIISQIDLIKSSITLQEKIDTEYLK